VCVGFQWSHMCEARGKGSKACVRFPRRQIGEAQGASIAGSMYLCDWITGMG
jgi:hypothetical protein